MGATYRILALVTALLLVAVGFLAVEMMTGGSNIPFLRPTQQQRLEAVAEELNTGAPVEHENGSRFDFVEAIPGGLRIQFTMMNFASTEVDHQLFRDQVFAGSRQDVCQHPTLRALLVDEQTFVETVFNGNDDKRIASFRIDSKSCEYGGPQ